MSDYIEDLSIISKQAVHQESDSDSDLFELSSVGSACTHLADSLNDDEEASREPLRKKIKKEEDPELWRAQYRPCLLTQEEYDLYSTDEDTVVPSTIPKVYYSPISFGGNGNCWGTSPKNCTKKNTVQKSESILQGIIKKDPKYTTGPKASNYTITVPEFTWELLNSGYTEIFAEKGSGRHIPVPEWNCFFVQPVFPTDLLEVNQVIGSVAFSDVTVIHSIEGVPPVHKRTTPPGSYQWIRQCQEFKVISNLPVANVPRLPRWKNTTDRQIQVQVPGWNIKALPLITHILSTDDKEITRYKYHRIKPVLVPHKEVLFFCNPNYPTGPEVNFGTFLQRRYKPWMQYASDRHIRPMPTEYGIDFRNFIYKNLLKNLSKFGTPEK
jgi:hypothetical protein